MRLVFLACVRASLFWLEVGPGIFKNSGPEAVVCGVNIGVSFFGVVEKGGTWG